MVVNHVFEILVQVVVVVVVVAVVVISVQTEVGVAVWGVLAVLAALGVGRVVDGATRVLPVHLHRASC